MIIGNFVKWFQTLLLDDIDNQGAAHLARLADEDGLRTIGTLSTTLSHGLLQLIIAKLGVLTKPDTIQHGEDKTWLRILEGATHSLTREFLSASIIYLPC